MDHPADILEKVVAELGAGRRAALAAVVATRGSTPQPAGALTCIDADGRLIGTLGGGCVEAEIRRRAHAMLCESAGRMLTFTLDHDEHDRDGMICGGQMDVAVEILMPRESERIDALRHAATLLRQGCNTALTLRTSTADTPLEYRLNIEAPPRLVIAGGGHISRILARFALELGFRITVLDDRAEYANPRRFPPPIESIAAPIPESLRAFPVDAGTFIVIVTRGHAHDEDALHAVLGSRAKYIGMIGSRRKIDVTYARLRERGATPQQLAAVHAPIGLPIRAVTTSEIAVSIAAELVAVRRATHFAPVEGPFPLEDSRSPRVTAT
ncbi:MAG: XdhC family protein [Phycisphaerales bacterium]|nr:XdhC family protein [Phycisphaerales bacterium]